MCCFRLIQWKANSLRVLCLKMLEKFPCWLMVRKWVHLKDTVSEWIVTRGTGTSPASSFDIKNVFVQILFVRLQSIFVQIANWVHLKDGVSHYQWHGNFSSPIFWYKEWNCPNFICQICTNWKMCLSKLSMSWMIKRMRWVVTKGTGTSPASSFEIFTGIL